MNETDELVNEKNVLYEMKDEILLKSIEKLKEIVKIDNNDEFEDDRVINVITKMRQELQSLEKKIENATNRIKFLFYKMGKLADSVIILF